MPRLLTVAALLLVCGCGQQTGSTATTSNETAANSNETAAAPAATAAPEVPALDGEWQVTKLDGRPGGSSVVTFAGGKVRIVAGCTRRAWSFTQKRNIINLAADPGGSANCESPPSVQQEAMIHALDRATMAIFDQQGREATLSGSGGNITLERR